MLLANRRSYLFDAILVIFLLLIFEVLTKLPISYLYEVVYYAFKLILVSFFIYYLLRVLKSGSFNKLLLIILPVVIIPFISAFKANDVYGQPYYLGLLVERAKVDFLIPLLLVWLLERKTLSLQKLETIMVKVSKGYLLLIFLVYLLIDPIVFKGTDLVSISQDKGALIKLNNVLGVFIFIYSYIKVINERKYKYLLYLIIGFFTFTILSKARFLSVSVLIVISYHLLFYTNLKAKINVVVFGLLILILGFAFLSYFFPDQLSKFLVLFMSAFNVILGGEVIDSSAASRIIQSEIAWEGIKNHPLFGTGLLSNKHEGGYLGLYKYFYPSDIGWVANVFLYGIVGFVILKIPFLYGLTYRYRKSLNKDAFFISLKLFFMFFFIHGIVAAYEVNKIGMYLFVFGLLYYYRYSEIGSNSIASDTEAAAIATPR